MLTREELINKYIKYDSSITEEMFNAIIKKLKEAHISNPPDNIRTSFTEFKEEKHIFNLNYNNERYYIGNIIASADVEIQVSDILGEETKFEVGKWYSFYWNWSSGYNCIGKVCQVNTCEKTTIHFDNYTSNNSPGKLFTDGRTIYLAEIENIKELNLEEIQQYLPDNHPDKLVKPIEKWSDGTWVVCIKDYSSEFKVGKIANIKVTSLYGINGNCVDVCDYLKIPCFPFKTFCEWFATLSEAEAFSKSLLEPEKEDLNKYDSEDNLIKMKKYVKCDTKEQWDFVKTKYNQKTCSSLFHKNRYIDLTPPGNSYYNHELTKPYKLYTFQEWLDLNDYTLEEGSKEKFKIGDYVISLIDTFNGREKGDLLLITGEDSYIIIATNKTELFSDTIASDEIVRSLRKATAAEIMAVTKPKEKPFEFNKWYKSNNVDGLFFIQSENTGYGFRSNHVNCWFTNNGDFEWNRDGLELATNSEVKKRLLSYAKEKYPVGTKFKELNVPYSLKEFNEAEFDYYPEQDQLTCGGSIYIKGKWAEVISTPEVKEVKEMQLSDLKNPIFNVGDKVMVTADSLKEFNSSWERGNNTSYKKGYIGTVSNAISSSNKEINTWCYLEDHYSAISCNLLELVESSESSKPKKIDRNVYFEVETQEQYNEVLDWLEGNGEQVNKGYGVIDPWKYICFENCEWSLNRKVESQLSKAEFQFKGKSEKQPIKAGMGLREQILQNQYQYEYKTIDSSSVWETLINPHTQNFTINLKQEPIKLLSFEEDDVVLFKTNSVKISNKQLIIND